MDEVYHVGSLDRSRRNLGGYEADSLSVSWCPDTWWSLARCKDTTIWKLAKNGGLFLDIDAVKKPLRREILKWAEFENLIERIPIYRAQIEDEDDSGSFSEHRSEDEALNESSTVTKVKGWGGTTKLDEARGLGNHDAIGSFAEEFAIMTFAERSGLDGVWWKWPLSPEEYLAPKGCIFPDQLALWVENKIQLKSRDLDDELMLKNFPKTKAIEISSNLLRSSIEISIQ